MAELTAAMAWALASKVALIDARHCEPQESAEKREEAAALFEHAAKLDAMDGLAKRLSLCLRAQAYMEAPVKPAAHYAPERYRDLPSNTVMRHRSGGFIRILEMRGEWAYCEPIKRDGSRDRRSHGWSGSLRLDDWHTAFTTPRKPTRRRGTKPTSLPECLSRAAKALKEP